MSVLLNIPQYTVPRLNINMENIAVELGVNNLSPCEWDVAKVSTDLFILTCSVF